MKPLLKKWPLLLSWLTAAFFLSYGHHWLIEFTQSAALLAVFSGLFLIILKNSFMIAYHVERLSESVPEPFGTLILTLSIISLEVVLIASTMLIGENNPTLARDTMYAVIMIVLNGIVGLSLLAGGLRYREQQYNLQGSISFLSVIVLLAVVGLVLPNFTMSTLAPTFTFFQEIFLIVTSLGIYAIFLSIQTVSHRAHFIAPVPAGQTNHDVVISKKIRKHKKSKSITYHCICLSAYLLPTLYLAKQTAFPINYMLKEWHAPVALGGMIVAIIVLAPEGVSAIRASLANQLQRSVNLSLGSVLATIGLTIPVILTIGLITNKTIILGLNFSETTVLLLSLLLSVLTFVSGRTNILQGAVHLLLFLVYMMMIFD